MKTSSAILAAAIILAGGVTSQGQTRIWTGAGDGVSWTNAYNWSGGLIPGFADYVFITNGTGATVVISSPDVSVRSVQCSKGLALSGGSLALSAGASLLNGTFTISNGASLTVSGSGASLTANGITVDADGNFYAFGGGAIHLPNLKYVANNNDSSTWRADGAGSLLDLSAVTNLTLAYYEVLYVEAYNGGQVDLHRVNTTTGSVHVDAQDAGTIVDLSGLAGRWKSAANSWLSLEAQTGASILIPNVTQLEYASLRVDNTGIIATAQLNLLTNVMLTVDAAAPNFGRVTNIDDSSIYALEGGVAGLTNVLRVFHGNQSPVWDADGAGSLVDLSMVTNLAMAYYQVLDVEAYNGGAVDLHRVNSSAGSVHVDAQDAGTVVDFSGLAGRWKSTANSWLKLEAQTGASILIPNVTQFEYASLQVDNTGTIPTAQLNLLTNVTLTVDAAAPNFGRVTNIDDSSIYALEGGVARLTNVLRVTDGNQSPTWDGDGAGSLIDLSMLTNLTAAYYQVLNVEAHNGGHVDLHRMSSATGSVHVDAQDAGTVVDLSGLAGRWKSAANSWLKLEAQTGASILIPNVTQLEYASLRLDNTGTISTAQLNLLTNVTLTVDATAPNFGRVTNIDDSSVYALEGGVARLTNVFRVTEGNQSPVWNADGAGSLIDLSRLTNLTTAYYQVLDINAYNGGAVDCHRLSSSAGSVHVDAQDAGTVVDLSGLAGRWKSAANSWLKLEAQTGASILIPNVTQLEYASLRVDNTGTISTAQLNLLTNVTLTADAASPNFGRVTNIDDSSVYALEGGVARLTNVARVTEGTQSPAWHAEGAGSLVDLSAVTNLYVGYYDVLNITALNGGKVDLRRLPSLSTSAVQATADGTGSVIDFSTALSFISEGNGASSLSALNGGTILFNNQVFLLANVAINIPPGNPLLPATLIPSPSLTLYGKAWDSYWVEKRDTRSDLNPWVFMARVPLTNSFQPFAPAPAPYVDLRVWDFVANPPLIDLFALSGQRIQMIIYDTPGKTNQLLTTTSPAAGTTWQPGVVTAMTNAFRIMAPAAAPDPARFFRAKRL